MCPSIQYVTKTVEVESAQCKAALAEVQARNLALQEQLGVQRQLLHELEDQLHESQKTSGQLRQQVYIRHTASPSRWFSLCFSVWVPLLVVFRPPKRCWFQETQGAYW